MLLRKIIVSIIFSTLFIGGLIQSSFAQNADMSIDSVTLTQVNGAAVPAFGPLVPGQTATFRIVARNSGFFQASGATITARLNNSDAVYVSSSSVDTWNPASAGLTFTRRNPMPIGTETINVTVLVPHNAHYLAQGAITFSATASSANPDSSGTDQTKSTTDLAIKAVSTLTIEKTLLTPKVSPQGRALYDISICNNGPSSIDGVGIIDTPGANMTAGSAIFTSDASSLYIPALDCARVSATAEISASALDASTFSNTAQVNTSAVIAGNAALGANALAPTVNAPTDTENSGSVVVVREQDVDLRLLDTTLVAVNSAAVAPTGPIIPGLTAQFRIRVRNNGTTDAPGVTVTSLLQGIPGVSVASQVLGQPWTQGSSGLTFTRGEKLPAGATEALLVTLFIPSDAHYAATGPVSFVSGVTSSLADSNFANNTATTGIINLKAISDLTLDKLLLTKKVAPNGTALYNIEICNRGFSDIKGLGINDVTGANLSALSLVIPQTADTDSLYVPAAECIDLPVSARINSGAIAGSVFANTATIDISNVVKGSLLLLGNVDAPVVNAATDSDNTGEVAPILPNADVQIDTVRLLEVNGAAVGVGGPIVPGQTAKFEIKIRNVGPDQAFGATLVNRFSNIDAKVVDTSAPADWSPAGDGFTFTRLNPMPAGATETITLTMLVPSDAHYTTVANLDFVSSLSAVNPETNIFNNTASTGPLSVQLKAGLTLNTTLLSGTVAPGGLILAEAEICNPGPSDIKAIKFTATAGSNIQPGSIVVSFSPNTNGSYIEASRCVDALVSAVVSPAAVVGAPFSIVISNDNSMLVNGAAVLGALAFPPSPLPNLSSTVTGTVGNYLPNADVQVVSTKLTKVNNVASALTGPIVAGQRAEFEVVVKNNGPSPAQGVVLVNQLRALGAVVVASTSVGSPWSPVGSGLSFTRRDPMPAGVTETLTFTVDIPADAHYTATRRIQLNSFVTADNPDQTNGNNRLDTGDINIKAIADLSIRKTLLTPRVAPGGTAQYEINVCNAGPSDISGIEVKDLPGAKLVAGTLVLSSDASNLYVYAGDCVDVAASVQVTDTAAVGESFVNVAEVEAAAAVAGNAQLGVTAIAPVVNEPSVTNSVGVVSQYLPNVDIQVLSTKLTEVDGAAAAPTDPIVPGLSATFEVVVKNDGPAPAEAVTLLNRIANLEAFVIRSSSTAPWTLASDGLSFNRQAPMPAGTTDTLTVTVKIPADAHYQALGAIVFSAAASSSNPDVNTANNSAETGSRTVQAKATLSIDKQLLSPNVSPGGLAQYEIVVCSSGPSDLNGLAVVDTLGAKLVPGSLIISSDSSDFYLAANHCADFMATAQVTPSAAVGETYSNTAAVETASLVNAAPGVDALTPVVNKPSDTDASGIVGEYLPNANMEVVSAKLVKVNNIATAVTGPLVPGQRAEFEIVVKNNGPSPAEGALLLNRLRGLDGVVVASSTPASPWSPVGSGLSFHRLNPMAAGVTETLTFTVDIPSDAHYEATTEVVLNSFVSADNPDQTPGNNRKDTPFLNFKAKADLSITKNLFTPRVAPGGTAQYEITVCNAGPSDVDGVEVTDTPGTNLVAGTLILSADAKDLYVGSGRCVDVTATVQVSDASVVGASFTNKTDVEAAGVLPGSVALGATALAPTVNEPTNTNTAGIVSEYLPNADVTVVSANLVEVGGVASTGPIVPGKTAKFEIIIRNDGPAPAEAVTVLSRLTNVNTTVVSATSPGSPWSNGGAGLGFSRQLPMAANDTDTLSITVNIPADAHYTSAGDIDFRAYVSASNPDPNLGNNRVNNDKFDVQAVSDLNITKTLLTTQVAPDGTALFEITVCNAGPSDIRGVKAIDTPGLNLVTSSLVMGANSKSLYVKAGQCVDISASARVKDTAAPITDNFKNSASLDVSMVDAGVGSTLAASVTASGPSEVTGLVSNYLPVADVQILAKRIVSGTMVPGTTATFEIDVINNGPAYAEGVIVTDDFSNVDFTFVSSSVPSTWNGSGSSGTFTRQSPMRPGVKETLSLTLLIASDAHLTATGPMSNTAYVVASNPDSNPNNNSATTGTIATQGQSVLTLTKTLLGDFVLPDTTATFEIEVCNAGPSDVHGLKITDTPGVSLDAKTLILSPGAMSLNVPADECRSVTASVQVNYGLPAGTKFVNEAAVDTTNVAQGTGATLAAIVNAPTAMAMGLVGPELFSITGRVEDSTGVGIPNATVSTGTGLSGVTDANGDFVITSVASGSYHLDAIASNGTALGGKDVAVADANLTGVVIVAIQPVSGQVNFVWNGFLQQANILVLINKGDRMVDASIKLFDLNGNQSGVVNTKLSPNSERDVIINDVGGFQANSYGYLGVEFNNPKDFDGHMAFYRLSKADSRDVEFSIIKPFDKAQKGTSFGTFNTMQPSANPAEKNFLVQQWIQIINLSSAVQQYTLTFYDLIGKEIRQQVVAVPARARRDFEGGHINPGPGFVGTIKVEPSDANAEYLAQIFRYGGDAPQNVVPDTFSFAMGLTTQKGGNGTQYAPLSTAKGGVNFVVVTNIGNTNSTVSTTGTSADGSGTFAQTLNLAPFAQAHINAASIIQANEQSGLLKLNSASNLIIESTVYYYDPAKGGVTTAYNTSGRSISLERSAGIYNNFLSAENMMKLHNVTNNPVTATLEVYDLLGNSVGVGRISIAPRGVAEIELTLGFRLPRNTYGLVAVDSSVPGAIFSEILRTKQSLVTPNITDLAASIPVR